MKIETVKKEGLPRNVICVKGQADEAGFLIMEGYIVPQENVFGVSLDEGEHLFVPGFRALFPEMDFKKPLKEVVALGFDGILEERTETGLWLACYTLYIGAVVARVGAIEVQISRRRKVFLEKKGRRNADIIVQSLLFLSGRLGYSHSQQNKIRAAIKEALWSCR